MCDELRKYFDDAPEKYELSIAIPASPARFEIGYDLGSLSRSVHFFNVMAYDLHGIWDEPPIVGAHSDIGVINEAIEYMVTNSSVPPVQVVLGLPAYGRSYTMANKTCVSLGCSFKEESNETAIGGCLDTVGFVPFVEIYQWQEQGEGRGYDSISVDITTYSTVMLKDDYQLISYDNAETFKAKIDYATDKCLGGTMVWAIDMLPIGTQSASGGKGGESGSGIDESAPQSILDEDESILAFCGKDWVRKSQCHFVLSPTPPPRISHALMLSLPTANHYRMMQYQLARGLVQAACQMTVSKAKRALLARPAEREG